VVQFVNLLVIRKLSEIIHTCLKLLIVSFSKILPKMFQDLRRKKKTRIYYYLFNTNKYLIPGFSLPKKKRLKIFVTSMSVS